MDSLDLQTELAPVIRKGDTQSVIARVEKELKQFPHGPFHIILELDFTNAPQAVAQHFDTYCKNQNSNFKVEAIYTETNGFDINPDRWYFSLFAFKTHGGHEDYDWLGDWDSEDCPDMTLTGLESLQAVYDSDAFSDESQSEACVFCSMLVMAKFQDLIRRSAALMREVKVPVLATSHDCDFIAEFRP